MTSATPRHQRRHAKLVQRRAMFSTPPPLLPSPHFPHDVGPVPAYVVHAPHPHPPDTAQSPTPNQHARFRPTRNLESKPQRILFPVDKASVEYDDATGTGLVQNHDPCAATLVSVTLITLALSNPDLGSGNVPYPSTTIQYILAKSKFSKPIQYHNS
jgi:hypothetical protein